MQLERKGEIKMLLKKNSALYGGKENKLTVLYLSYNTCHILKKSQRAATKQTPIDN